MRNAFAETFYELAQTDDRLHMLVADISPAGSMVKFRERFPHRFVNTGVAEQIMIGMAAGMSQRGLKPFCYTIATFALFRPYEFVRCDLAYQNLPVTVVGMGAGLSYPSLGGTHQAVEDVGIACAMPNLTVLAPSDPQETADMVRWCAARDEGGPVYLRLGKAGEPETTYNADEWVFGQLRWLHRKHEKPNYTIMAYGPATSRAIDYAGRLREAGSTVNVVAVSTLKPLHVASIVEDVLKVSQQVVVIEEALSPGGLGQQILAIAKQATFPTNRPLIEVNHLGRNFPHEFGSRDDLLNGYWL